MKFFRVLFFDINVTLSILSKGWSVIKTPALLFFIARSLNEQEQGYWYTFISLGALTVFAEMGFTTIISQFISHEFAHLTLSNRLVICGQKENIERLGSLIWFSIKKFVLLVPLSIVLILLIGYIFFRNTLFSNQAIFIPWFFYVLSGGLTLLVSLFSSIIQGINQVKYTLTVTLIINVLSTISIVICLQLGLGLWALSITGLSMFIISTLMFVAKFRLLLIQVFHNRVTSTPPKWVKELFPLQLRYSISWIAGYFIFNFIVPITMYFSGPILAGKVGITLSMSSAVLQMAHSWVATKMPELNILVSSGKKQDAKSLFVNLNKKSLLFFLSISILICLFFLIADFMGAKIVHLIDKFLPLSLVAILFCADFSKLLLGNWAVYLRAFKIEPFLYITVSNALLTIAIFAVCLPTTSSIFLSLVLYSIVQFVSLLWGRKIYLSK